MAYPFEPPRAGREPFAISRISDRHAWLAGFVSAFRLFWSCAWSRGPCVWSLLRLAAWGTDGVRGYGEMAMDYDWLWVILAVGVLAPVGVVPFALARDACCWWREQRRGHANARWRGVSYRRA